MKSLGPSEWAKRTARRLRVSHHSFSDQTFEEKREFLEDELDFALGDVGADGAATKDRYLEALEELFPIFGADLSVDREGPAKKKAVPKSAVQKVLEGWKVATEEERASIMSQLGLVPAPSPPSLTSSNPIVTVPPSVALPSDAEGIMDLERTMAQVARVLLLSEGDEISFTRLFKLMGILVDNFERLHSFLWEFWDYICPSGAVGMLEPEIVGGLTPAIRSYLTGDDEVSSAKISKEIDTTKLLALAVCSSINQGGEEFGRQFGNRFSPDEIESSVIIEDTGGDPSRIKELEKKSWLKYRQLAKNLTPEGVDDELRILLGQVIAAWMKRNRK